ncbi:RNA-binding cell elongation regulator Jag/EloR [Granulicatella seriolae]|uniref:RNA-binding protein KhpB n=1 Tax=Granulicatella seriolae TaxID=2967226 RepID=A0ABT1WQE8_9LACT|nr:RNA-binding cell elongation regulator Jag/EloR [Granulicatella seriolae]
MSNLIRISDTTVDKAIQKGLNQLNAQANEVDITVISDAKKGIFGFWKKNAVVELRLKEDLPIEEASDLTMEVTQDAVDQIVAAAEESQELDLEEEIVELDEEEEDEEDTDHERPAEISGGYQEALLVTSRYLEDIANVYGAPATVTIEEEKGSVVFRLESDKPGLLIGKHGKIVNSLQSLTQVLVQRYVRGRISVLVDVGDYRQRRSDILKDIANRTASKVLRTKQPVFLEPLPAYERKQIHAHLSQNKRISTHSEGKEPHRYLVVEIAE